ncbi:MAG TPA: CHAD domain-containing protein [Roseiflexaceae bacterium]|nr:CHAD domain-containing protein [Roseiflexaceae bacterium]
MTQTLLVPERELPPRATAAALTLLDGVATQLPKQARRLLELAATYYSAGRQSGDERAERAGRDMALAAPIEGLSADEQAIVASAVAFQREKPRPNREPAFLRLGEKDQQTALRLAAILRLAGAIEAHSLDLRLLREENETVTLIVGGARAAEATAVLEAQAQLWRESIGPLAVRAAEPGEIDATGLTATNGSTADDRLPAQLGQSIGGEPIAEAARRQLRRFFDKLLSREEAVIKDEDIEDVHQMRVATRRLRASLQVVEGVYDHELIWRYRRGLRQIARSLGAVRDGDVFLEHLTTYRESLPEAERARLDPLIEAVRAERTRAREQLLADLQAKRYQKFKRDFAEFLTTPGAGALASPEPGIVERVRDFAGSAIWRRYELWRAYEVALPSATGETLHQTRIAGKRFRYTLEFFAEALGRNVDQALAPLIALQENLGALQDDVTARAHIAALGLADDPGAQVYLAAREQERAALLAELPRLWEKVASATYRRRLFEMIVKM